VVACVCLDENLGFNMLMCVFCAVAIASLWTNDKSKEKEEHPNVTDEKTEKFSYKKS